MAEKGRDPSIIALEAIYAALKDLDSTGRRKVLSSAFALLGLDVGAPFTVTQPNTPPQPTPTPPSQTATRPLSLGEFMQEKTPGTNDQRIAAFAYYRERHEGLSRFSRDDLKPYFAKAKLTPAANFDRDFGKAVSKAWIHEDGADSYLTTKGIEAVENGFGGDSIKAHRKAKTRLRKKKR